MKALILYESYFGNTRRIAETVAAGVADRGVDTHITAIENAPETVPADVDILILGAPTHNRHLPSPKSREKALAAGAQTSEQGVAEWLAAAELNSEPYAAIFDTSTGKNWLSGSAAKHAAKLLAHREPPLRAITKTFLVDSNEGPLTDGELDAARTWGRLLAADARALRIPPNT